MRRKTPTGVIQMTIMTRRMMASKRASKKRTAGLGFSPPAARASPSMRAKTMTDSVFDSPMSVMMLVGMSCSTKVEEDVAERVGVVAGGELFDGGALIGNGPALPEFFADGVGQIARLEHADHRGADGDGDEHGGDVVENGRPAHHAEFLRIPDRGDADDDADEDDGDDEEFEGPDKDEVPDHVGSSDRCPP